MSTIDTHDAEIARLQAELARVEQMPDTIANRFSIIERELRDAERLYRERGLHPAAPHREQQEHLARLAIIGMSMAVNATQILAIERKRIADQGEGLSASDKAAKRAQLQSAIMKAAAQRELALRAFADDFTIPRPAGYAQFAVYRLPELQRLAAQRS